jgi:phage-related protein
VALWNEVIKCAKSFFCGSDSDDKPVEDFLASLEPDARAKVVRTLELLQAQLIVPAKFWKKLAGSTLWEVRVQYAGNVYRILAATAKGNRVILLHGFQKKSQETPPQDMEIAQQRQKRYFQRHGYL